MGVCEEPLQILFEKYQEIIRAIPVGSMLQKASQDLSGILACVIQGKNQEKIPAPLKHVSSAYYAWFSWRKHTILLEEQLRTSQDFNFHDLAMFAYIEYANQYIRTIGLLI